MTTKSRFSILAAAAGFAALALAGCGSAVPVVGDIPMNAVASRAGPGNSHFVGTHPNDFSIHGIDVSKYQGQIDWRAVRDSGVQFAWIKATEGADHLDERFAENWAAAKAAGVPRGAYHFVYWCRTPAEEIGWFKRNVPNDPDALPPVLDVEATQTSKTCTRRLEREQTLRDIRQMLQDMERHYGKRPVIYSTVDFYEAILAPNELSDYPIWVRSTKHPPSVRYGARRWHFWQYQSDGRVPGIDAKVDRNAFHGSRAQWMAFAQGAPAPRQ